MDPQNYPVKKFKESYKENVKKALKMNYNYYFAASILYNSKALLSKEMALCKASKRTENVLSTSCKPYPFDKSELAL